MKHIIVIKGGIIYSIVSYDLTEYKTEEARNIQEALIEKDFISTIQEHYKGILYSSKDALHECFLDGMFNVSPETDFTIFEELTVQLVRSSFNSISFT